MRALTIQWVFLPMHKPLSSSAPKEGRAPAVSAASASSLADMAYDRLKADLFDLALLPGDAFTEAEVVNVLGVSRTPVRQALQRLAREGFVQVSSRSGWRVRPFDFDRFENLYDLRIILELAAVDRLCAMHEPAKLPVLQDLWARWNMPVEGRLPPGRDSALQDEAFHCALVAAAGNPETAAVHHDVTEKISVVRRLDFTQQSRVDATYEEHVAILRAIFQRRADTARTLLKSHIEVSKTEVRKITIHNLHAHRESYFRQEARWRND